MQQSTYNDIRKVKVPVDVVCGKFDTFVAKCNLEMLTDKMKNVRLFMINERHEITPGYVK